MTNRNRRTAFTFLEIMFVVVIIGVLLAIAVPKMTGKGKKARIEATKASMRAVKIALSEFELKVGRFPTTSEGLDALITRPSAVSEEQWEEPFFDDKKDLNDAFGKTFQYRSPGEHKKDYDLWSNGPDGQDGTDDDVKDWSEK